MMKSLVSDAQSNNESISSHRNSNCYSISSNSNSINRSSFHKIRNHQIPKEFNNEINIIEALESRQKKLESVVDTNNRNNKNSMVKFNPLAEEIKNSEST